jgi:acetylornithine deacetylase/succinyl-diaminopimelate desuccinylase-like protein
MMVDEARILAAVAARRDDLIAFCRRLIQTPSVNGVDDEANLAVVIRDEARRLGLAAQIVGENPRRPNVTVSTAGEGDLGLLLLGHLDTVPPGDAAGWMYPPFSAQVADGRIYGRGAIDTKGGMAASLYALAALQEAAPDVRAQFIGVPDEETGATGTLGIKYLAAHSLLKAKGAIYAYSGREIVLGHRGLLRYRVTCAGESVHTGSSEWQERTAGANAVTGLARLLLALESAEFPHSASPYFEPYRTVITPGTVFSGGVSINIVPDRAEALIDVRTTPENDRYAIEALIERAAGEITAANPRLQFAIECLNDLPAAISDERAPVFAALASAVETVTGTTPPKTVAGPANEGYLLIERGIPTVCGFGVSGANAHAPNEYVEIDSLVETAQIFALTAARLAP